MNIAGGTCPALSAPANGQMFDLGNNTNYFKCNDGYILNGDSSRNCQDTGIWTGTEATCEADGLSGRKIFSDTNK